MREHHYSTSWINVTAWTFKREVRYSVKKDHLPTKYSITEPNCYWLQPGIRLRVVSLFLEIEWGECMCAPGAAKCEKRWRRAKKNKTGFASIFSFFLPLPPHAFNHSHNHFCLLCVSLDRLGKKRDCSKFGLVFMCTPFTTLWLSFTANENWLWQHNQNSSSLQRSDSCWCSL